MSPALLPLFHSQYHMQRQLFRDTWDTDPVMLSKIKRFIKVSKKHAGYPHVQDLLLITLLLMSTLQSNSQPSGTLYQPPQRVPVLQRQSVAGGHVTARDSLKRCIHLQRGLASNKCNVIALKSAGASVRGDNSEEGRAPGSSKILVKKCHWSTLIPVLVFACYPGSG